LKKILITGGTGLLGASLSSYLRNLSYQVEVVSRNNDDFPLRLDLTDYFKVHDFLNKSKPDIIINLAALTNVDRCENFPNEAYLNNVKIPENLASWSAENQEECHIIQFSTDQVYGFDKIHLEEEVMISNVYGLTKYAGEMAFKGLPCTVLRTNFVGKSLNKERKSLSDWAIEAVKDQQPITVFSDIFFSPLSLTTLIETVEKVIKNPKKGIFNLGSTSVLSKSEFVLGVLHGLNLSRELVTIGSSSSVELSAPRPKNMGMNSSLFEATFNIRLPSFHEEVIQVVEEYKNGR